MTTMLLIRHATTAATGRKLGGRTQASLDDNGKAQAAACAKRLAGVPLKAIYASPLPRTMETAAAVAQPHHLDVTQAEGMIEVDYGRWTDRALGHVRNTKLWPVIQATPSKVVFPDGEGIAAMQHRALTEIERIVSSHRSGTVAVVSHADVIKAAVAGLIGMPLDLFQRLHVAPASVTVLDIRADHAATLLRFNDDGPLELGTPKERKTG